MGISFHNLFKVLQVCRELNLIDIFSTYVGIQLLWVVLLTCTFIGIKGIPTYSVKFCSVMFQHNDNHRQTSLSSCSSQNYGSYHKYHTLECKSLQPQAMHHITKNMDKTMVFSTQTQVTDI